MRNSKAGYSWLLIDIVMTCVALHIASLLRLAIPLTMDVKADVTALSPLVYVFVVLIWSISLVSLGVYDYSFSHSPTTRLKIVLGGVGLCTVLLAGLLYLTLDFRETPRVLYLYFVVLDGIFLGFPRAVQIWLTKLHFFKTRARRIIIVGGSELGTTTAQNLLRHRQVKLLGFVDDRAPTGSEISGLPVLGQRADLSELVSKYSPEIVVLALPADQQAAGMPLVIELQKRSVEVLIVPDLHNSGLVWTGADKIGELLMINLNETRIKGLNRLVKRAFDVVLALFGLIFFSPIMLIVALLIKLDSPGPVLFTQSRVGECCRLFKIYKFRTMSNGAHKQLHQMMREVDGKLVHKHRNDPRITKIGRFLRATSLDELPNLFNVLLGEMSIVGPRPELPELVAHYEPFQFGRLSVPPGMTGWWQVNGRSDKPLHLNTAEDMYYVENYSFMLDIRIIWRTVWVILRRKGAF